MSNIQTYLEKIKSARYGKDVRQSIHDAIKEIDSVASTAQNSASNSAKSALVSETSAKASMESALVSEANAKQYMETAFSGTPEGYAALVEQVGRIDIAKSTDYTLPNSKKGGYRLQKLLGNTEQKKLSGKQLFDAYAKQSTTYGSATVSENGAKLSVSGVYYSSFPLVLEANTSYVTSYSVESYTSIRQVVFIYEDDTIEIFAAQENEVSFVFTPKTRTKRICLYSGRNADGTTVYRDFMVRLASVTDDTWEPYLGGVELVQGNYSTSTGNYVNSSVSVCIDKPISCKSGDVVKIGIEKENKIRVLFYQGNTFVSFYTPSENYVTSASATIPSGVNNFKFHLTNASDITPQTVGKVTLTVNGKPIYVHAGAYTGGITSPSPYYPQSLNHTNDVVEMVQGGFSGTNGTFSSDYTKYVASKYPVPCKSGDTIEFALENADNCYTYYYNDNGFIQYALSSMKNEHSFTVPIGVTKFNFVFGNDNGEVQTPDTVGKITLTINGKYVGCVKTIMSDEMIQGAYNQSSGVFTSSDYAVASKNARPCKSGDSIRLLTDKTNTDANHVYLYYNESGFLSADVHTAVTQSTSTAPSGATSFRYYVSDSKGLTVDTVGKIALTINGIGETIAWYYTNEPLRLGDFLFKDGDGLFKVERNVAEITLNGSEVIQTPSTNRFDVIISGVKYGSAEEPNAISTHYIGKYEISNGSIFSSGVKSALSIVDERFSTVEDFVAWLTESQPKVQYKLATPYIEVLDTESQIALNGLETFGGVTHIEVDSKIPPTSISGECGTSQVGAYTLQALNENDIDKVERAEMKAQTETLRNMILSLGGNA